jgi:hypothetical protein
MNSKSTTDASAQFERSIADLTIPGTDLSGVSQQLMEAATRAGYQSCFCSVSHAGQRVSGTFFVQINDIQNGGGVSTQWPQWAFELAKAALLSDKLLWVISDGKPFGVNLQHVRILAPWP